MDETTLACYQRELNGLRSLGRRFAADFPKVAGRLQLSDDVSPDPHVERLIESVALLAARIHRRVDDSYADVAEALLSTIYPHLTRPTPARTIARITPKSDQLPDKEAYVVPRDSLLEMTGRSSSRMETETAVCRFRTVFPVELWPVEVTDASFERLNVSPLRRRRIDGRTVLRLRLACREGATFAELPLDRLRFHLDGDASVACALYELLNAAVIETSVGHPDAIDAPPAGVNIAVAPDIRVTPAGLEPNEGVLDYDPRSHPGYRLLHEYFTFPEKFLFIDVSGLRSALASAGRCADLYFVFAPRDLPNVDDEDLTRQVSPERFKLGCTPIVNLFSMNAEPIRTDRCEDGAPVIPDIRRPAAYEVYEVRSATLLSRNGEILRRPIPPLLGQHTVPAAASGLWWFTARRPSPEGGAETVLHLADRNMSPGDPAEAVIGVSVTVTNRDLPTRMPVNQPGGDMELTDATPVVDRIHCLERPRRSIRPGFDPDRLWRLISHLSLNRVSLADAGALRGLLNLYNFADPRRDPYLYDQMRQQIAGVAKVTAGPTVSRFGPLHRSCFLQGVEIGIEIDEDCFVGGGAYLFGVVLERFLGLYVAANSFVRVKLTSSQRKEEIASWAPRAGDAVLI